MKRLIINADDFGLSEGVNRGIINCFQEGILTSTSIMVNQPCLKHAYKLWKENRGLAVGLHLTLDRGKALTGISSLTDSEGNFLEMSQLIDLGKESDFRREIKAQLEKYNDVFGCDPSHIDSHNHIHLYNPTVLRALKNIASEFGLKYRRQKNLLDKFSDEGTTLERLIALLNEKKYEDIEYIELLTRPSYIDKKLLENSDYTESREKEMKILISPEFKSFVKDRFILQTYRDI